MTLDRCPWYVAGPLMGLLIVGLRAVLNKPFGALGGAVVSGEPVAWTNDKPERRHVVGSLLFGTGWSLACTCPGPLAVMVGEGRLGGLFVVFGLLVGVTVQGVFARKRAASVGSLETAAAGL
jgi:uncharacterized membrane protein YedE/YeeE